MKRHIWNKWPLLGLAATAVVLAAPADDGQEALAKPGGQKPASLGVETQHANPVSAAGQQAGRVELERLRRLKPEEQAGVSNVFSSVSWYEPPPPPPLPETVQPEVPVAPPVPFTYFGRYEDPPSRIVMLAKDEHVYTVSEGDVIDETYRVEHIADGTVNLVYLPLGTNQTISMGVQ